MASLKDRVALVTGSSRGIGRSIALALARAGCRVAVNCRAARAAAEEVVAAIGNSGGRAVAIRADVSLPADVERLVASTERELGAVEILVNNAGIARSRPLAELTLEDFEELLRVNLTSAFLLTQRVLPAMRASRWGRT